MMAKLDDAAHFEPKLYERDRNDHLRPFRIDHKRCRAEVWGHGSYHPKQCGRAGSHEGTHSSYPGKVIRYCHTHDPKCRRERWRKKQKKRNAALASKQRREDYRTAVQRLGEKVLGTYKPESRGLCPLEFVGEWDEAFRARREYLGDE
jgi:hypothetical protein